jgi:hypothetical protein
MKCSAFVLVSVAAVLAAAPALAAKKPPVNAAKAAKVVKAPAKKACGVYYVYSC